MNNEELLEAAKEAGFEHYGLLDIKTVHLLPEVREMCKKNTCGMYGKNWGCPPGCGTLKECEEKVSRFSEGLIVQTVGKLEDSFDFEGITEAGDKHKERFIMLRDILNNNYKEVLEHAQYAKNAHTLMNRAASKTKQFHPWRPTVYW